MPDGSDVGVIARTLHAFCVWGSRKFAERQTHDAKIHYFILKRITQIGNIWAHECAPKNSFFLCCIHLMLKFCCWGLLPQTPTGAVSLDPAWGLSSPGSLKPSTIKIQLRPWWIPETSAVAIVYMHVLLIIVDYPESIVDLLCIIVCCFLLVNNENKTTMPVIRLL